MDERASWPPASAAWTVRLLGRFEVVSSMQEHAKFRSKTVAQLLAYLCLHNEKGVSRFTLEETLWPESEGDRQAQNLRKAVADLRDSLEPESDHGSIVQTSRDAVSLNPDRVASDATHFWDLAEAGLKTNNAELLESAFELYHGPLLSTLTDDWAYAFRLEYEERFAQVTDALLQALANLGRSKDALRLGRKATVVAPLREDVHIALIRTYRIAGMETEALRQFEELERLMDDQWGEPPSLAARAAIEGSVEIRATSNDTQQFIDDEPAGGAVPVSSRFYVRRDTDSTAETSMNRHESVVLLHGPRQVGKSSLLARLLDNARKSGWAVAVTDFQALGETQLEDAQTFYKTLAYGVAQQVGGDTGSLAWNDWLGPNLNLDAIVGSLLACSPGRMCWAIDEADRLFGRPYANDFFGLLRSWHNRKAMEPDGPWTKLTLILSYATEAHLFITDLNQSPFNVGVRIPLIDFDRQQTQDLETRYANTPAGSWEPVHGLTNGHPFLSRRAFAYLSKGHTIEMLHEAATREDGPFGDHLKRILVTVSQDPLVMQEVQRLLAGQPFAQPTSHYRLWSSGVLRDTADGRPEFRVPGYREFLSAHLSGS